MTGSSFTTEDRQHMARAIRLARNGAFTADPNPIVGCVIVNNGSVVGEGWHAIAGQAHAEVNALNAAGDQAKGATAYVTLEPCCYVGRTGACTEALHKAGVAKVVYASGDPNPLVSGKGAEWLREQGIDVQCGLLEAEAEELNAGFRSRMQRGRPFVRSKIATSLDGYTALANGESQWISGEAARADVQRLRAASSAIVTGVATVLADDPSMNVRGESLGPVKQPLRVVLDTNLRMPAEAKMLAIPGDVLIVTAADEPEKQAALEAAGARVMQVQACDQGFVQLEALMSLLAQFDINDVLVEAGAELNGSLLQKGLIDELIVYQTAHAFGSGAQPMFAMPELQSMQDRQTLSLTDVRKVGDDLRLTYKV